MVPPSKKRKLPASSGPAPKRTKNSKPQSRKAKKSGRNNSAAPRRAVEATSLAWQSVGEEFGGLEVIEGVDVVRHGDRVQFMVASNQDKEAPVANDETDDNNKNNDEDDDDNEGESFEGFGDDAVEVDGVGSDEAGSAQAGLENEVAPTKGKSKAATREETKKDNKKDAKSKKKQLVSKHDEQLAKAQEEVQKSAPQGNVFDALADAEESQDDIDMAAWVPLNLSPPVMSAIARLGFAKPTDIQAQAIPEIIAGEDVIGKAQTGSGKTLAFGIPMVERWLEVYEGREEEAQKSGPMAVILSPTRELAKQLGDHLKALCDGLPAAPYVCVVTGGLSIHKQQRQLEKADFVVGTPGRLWEVLGGDMDLQDSFAKIRFLVVDEADRLFKVGQFKEAEDIIGALDKQKIKSYDDGSEDDESDESGDEQGDPSSTRQTLVFSATFDKDLQTKLVHKGKNPRGDDQEKMAYLMKCLKFRREPKFIDVNPVSQMATGLREGLIECGAMEKDLYLYTVLLLNPGRRTLVFTNSISAVRRLTPLLANLNLTALPLHSQMAQKARLRSLERFAASRNAILIATDVAARGLDIKEVDQVLHYHVPRAADTYIHRSGRTARGDRSGVSIMLCAPDEVMPTRRLAGKVHTARGAKRDHFIQTLPLDHKMTTRLKPRVTLAKTLADTVLAKEKAHSDDQWMRNAADELGVEYDSDDLEAANKGKGGRGGGRLKKEQAARGLTKAQTGALRAQLREELGRRINLGVSERYVTGGRVDIAALLKEGATGGVFLGNTDGLGFDL
ncbi:P-loop containing nucleoside triphosphate hydrolase protein [Dactylonectria estremocensis]|uniref:RNA helicase n=1 Tax=Dactylonectria estremocensis TaxID=1079267 RepID=A0A9P9E3C3_9HYPO|nr:P-loop containing nucleoside triphosphate hydrolase protein [Dactylonectria estremocensis]